ncbi:hypothetical protein Mal64_03450 [Pseudobythopirellula maris]|uniref:DUF4864 domain-containing protein n=1 Tax=Pseudobythopirellula maris TaxID=2527991 RepID=A0A5C5ZUR5_9BACT|nr:hypothetical protein [Pseudobythopirellula maris]TWT89963.1 hypothetical protein Mal64_03450 [Pseudobythopirellula maris]
MPRNIPPDADSHATPLRRLGGSFRLLPLLLVIVVGFGVGLRLGKERGVAADAHTASPDAEATAVDRWRPSPELRPNEVVRLQMQALSDFRNDHDAARRVFALASPLNRAATGPLPNFAQMLLHPLYSPMVVCERFIVGAPAVRGDNAVVLVTAVDSQGTISQYRFVLGLQHGEHEGCWMTDQVRSLLVSWDPGATSDKVPVPGDEA